MQDIIIKPSDKGGNVVLWPTRLYEQEALRHLLDVIKYKCISFNSLQKFCGELEDILESALEKGIFKKKQQHHCLLPTNPITLLLKIHKDTRNPPGHSKVSGN